MPTYDFPDFGMDSTDDGVSWQNFLSDVNAGDQQWLTGNGLGNMKLSS